MIPLLDLGNVVIRVDWEPFLQYLERNGEPSQDRHAFLRSSLFYDLEFGNIGPDEFVKRMGNMRKTQYHPDEFLEAFCAIFPDWMPDAKQLLGELLQRGPVYCLSNTNQIHLTHLLKKFPELTLFTKFFASHEIKKRKPYPGTYRQVTTDLVVAPKSIAFFDDLEANVIGAKKAGLNAFLYQNRQSVIENCFAE